jgi:hypothetical protein
MELYPEPIGKTDCSSRKTWMILSPSGAAVILKATATDGNFFTGYSS